MRDLKRSPRATSETGPDHPLGPRIQDTVLRIRGLGSKIKDPGARSQDTRRITKDPDPRIQDREHNTGPITWDTNTGSRAQNAGP